MSLLLSRPRLTVGKAFTEGGSSTAMEMITVGNNRGQVVRCTCQNTGECNYHNKQQGWSGSKVSLRDYKSFRRRLKAHVESLTCS